ncbi:MAG: segregation and condensation protein A [Anaerovoracaceae bacterium]|jgi:segregation and condensation protein A
MIKDDTESTIMSSCYKVKLDIFEGPFDLLVYLIERAEMNIYDIQISEIIEQYIRHVKDIQKENPILAGEFMVLASSLMEIKSQMLLPRNRDEEGEKITEDPRDQLVEKILEYKKYKAASELLAEKEKQAESLYCKPMEDPELYSEDEDDILKLDLKEFMNVFDAFLHRRKKLSEIKSRYNRVRRQQMSLETRIEQLKKIFGTKKSHSFMELLGEEKTRYNMALTFLSILELMKHKTIRVRQNVNFGEIMITADFREDESHVQ